MPNPALTEKIRNLPPLLDSLERDAEVSDLLRRSDAARERFRQMFPLDGVEQSALEDYRKEWMARYVYNSNAIEGSTLTLEDTELVLEGEFVPTDSPARYIFAARGILNLMLMAAGYRPVAIKHDAGRSYGKSLEAWQVDGDPKPFISQLVQCVDQEERAVAEIVGRLRENPFSENAIDGIGLEDGPARGRSL